VVQEDEGGGQGSKAPITESFLRWRNLKIVIIALLGGVAGQGVVCTRACSTSSSSCWQIVKDRAPDHQPGGGRLAHHRHPVLHRLRRPLRQDRPQEDHHGRPDPGRGDLLPIFKGW